MSFSNDTRDKISPKPLWTGQVDLLIWAIIAIQILVALVAFPFLPDRVPIHWNAQGQINGYGSKWIPTLLLPGMSLGIYGLLRGLTAIGPRLGSRSDAAANAQVRSRIIVGMLLFLLILQVATTAITLGVPIGVPFVLNLAVSVLFIFIGNYMGKLRRNFWMGIRTPWTLTSDVVWERTHRLGSWLFVIVGLIGIPLSFIPRLGILGTVALIILAAIFLCVYSYLCYRTHSTEGQEPLAPPFEPRDEG